MKSPFGSVQFIPGLGYIEGGTPGVRGLGDDSSVMMISGLNAAAAEQPASTALAATAGAQVTPSFGEQLSQPVTLFNVTLPVWGWLVLALALGGVGGFAVAKKS